MGYFSAPLPPCFGVGGGDPEAIVSHPETPLDEREDLAEDLPPRLPEDIKEVERAMMLCGSRAKGDLRARARRLLEQLIGKYPSVAEANRWKRSLKAYREELATELGQ